MKYFVITIAACMLCTALQAKPKSKHRSVVVPTTQNSQGTQKTGSISNAKKSIGNYKAPQQNNH